MTTAQDRYDLLQACRVIARTDSLSVVRQDGIDRLKAENTRLRTQVEAVRALLDNPGDACDAFSGTYIDIEVVRAALGEEEGKPE